MDIKTEIRKIPPGELFTLIQILEFDESWKKLMAIIPKTLSLDNFDCNIGINNLPKYNTDHFKLIENAGDKQRKNCAEILFEEWGTSGRIRPRLGHLLSLLKKAELFRAADYVAVKLLNISPPARPEQGPAAPVDTHISEPLNSYPELTTAQVERFLEQISYPSSILNEVRTPDKNIAQNNIKTNRIIPKIIINDFTNATNVSSETENANITSSNSTNSSQIQENFTDSTDVENNNVSVPDMIVFSGSSGQMPAISSLLDSPDIENNNDDLNAENISAEIPNISTLIQPEHAQNQSEMTKNNFSEEPSALPAFSQIFSETNVPAFSQILSASQGENSVDIPQISQLISSQNESSTGIPNLSELMIEETEKPAFDSNPSSAHLPNLSVLQSEKPFDSTSSDSQLPNLSALHSEKPSDSIFSDPQLPNLSFLQQEKPTSSEFSRKTSLSPVNGSSRSTCVSPLPNLSLNTVLPHFTYSELDVCTNCFDETMLTSHHSVYNEEPSGRKLGSGAFGSVYLALGLLDKPVAVKKLNLHGVNVVNIDDTITKQFRNEVELLCKYKHENLLSLLGYSCDGPTYCLIYEYICGGALKDRLQSSGNRLVWTNRLYIALGTARAVSYLHNAYSMPLIHRDIKSANILLDNADKPKLCDFGLIKLTPNQNTNTSTTVFGTSAYMAPEAFRGDVSVKLDTFSFGVVLLELLTGLPPLDENREGNDLVTHVEEVCEDDIKPLLDFKAGSWISQGQNFGEKLYGIATQCLEEKKRRPVMSVVVELLSKLIDETK